MRAVGAEGDVGRGVDVALDLPEPVRDDVGEILVDTEELYETAKEFMQQVMPQTLRKLKFYKDDIPLFNRFQIESQIENAYERTVRLPSGGPPNRVWCSFFSPSSRWTRITVRRCAT